MIDLSEISRWLKETEFVEKSWLDREAQTPRQVVIYSIRHCQTATQFTCLRSQTGKWFWKWQNSSQRPSLADRLPGEDVRCPG